MIMMVISIDRSGLKNRTEQNSERKRKSDDRETESLNTCAINSHALSGSVK